jgi:hypothetical protein
MREEEFMKLAQGGFGHNPRGKMYSYYVPNDARAGQRYVAPVTKEKRDGTSVDYKTMFTIMTTKGENSFYKEKEISRLAGMGINVKSVVGMDIINMLPGGQKYLNDTRLTNLQAMKAAWTRNSGNRNFKERLYRLWSEDFANQKIDQWIGGLF